MRCSAFKVVCALSLLLCLALAALWVRSYWHTDQAWVEHWNLYSFTSSRGRVAGEKSSLFELIETFDARSSSMNVRNGTPRPYSQSVRAGVGPSPDPQLFFRTWSRGRFGFLAYHSLGIGSETKGIAVPDWALLLLAAALPVSWLLGLRRRRRRWRITRNLCARCGYDLRASRGRCPECGMPFTKKPEASS